MVKKAILLLSAALSLGSVAQAQWCGTDEEYTKYQERYPQQMAAAEMQLAQDMQKLNLAQLKGTADDTFRIPVVVHVVHNYGTRNYVSDQRVNELIESVNMHYRMENPELSDVIEPFQKYIGNPRIQFYLATVDPVGRPTKGITHRHSYLTFGGDDQAKFDLWAPDRYLNIWVIDGIGREGVAAYSRFPSMAASDPYSDGIITDQAYVGGNDDGTTMAHEIGHYLNLMHIWGNTEVNTACGDDDVDDTPPTRGHPPGSNCNAPAVLYDTTCINNLSVIARVRLDEVNGQPIRVNSNDGMGIDFIARTGITIEKVDIYPSVVGADFDLALLSANGSGFDTLARHATNAVVNVGRSAPTNTTSMSDAVGVSTGIGFSALKAFRIEAVDIYPTTVNEPFRIVLLNGNDTLDSYSGFTSTTTGSQTVPVEFFVAESVNFPVATRYQLLITQNPGLLRDKIQQLPAPDSFTANLIAFTRARDTAAGPNQNAYNFMYNWRLKHKGITLTDTSAQTVSLTGFFAASDSGYRLSVIENPGLKTDSVAVPLYTREIPCIIELGNHITNNRYNGLYSWHVKYGYVKNCIDYPDTTNTQNLMDYALSCSINFTKGQVERMHAALLSDVGDRNRLAMLSTHIATGIYDSVTGKYGRMVDLPMVPDFSVEGLSPRGITGSHYKCASDAEFSFKNRSWGDTLESVMFEFVNGSVATSNEENGTIKLNFSQPGWATVKLTAQGNNTAPITIERTPVYAADPNNVINPLNGHFQGFSDPAENEKWPIFNYYNNDFRWKIVTNTGYYDQTSIVYTAFDERSNPQNRLGRPQGDFDDFFTPAYDLSGMKGGNCNLNFMYSGAFRVNDPDKMLDTFEIAYSTDCGNSWATLQIRDKEKIANKGSYQGKYAPIWMGDWALASIEIPESARESKVFFRFRYKPSSDVNTFAQTGVGNDFFVDRINISSFPLGVNTLLNENKKVAIAPNPTTGSSFIVIQADEQTSATVQVTDITGKVVYRTEAQLNGKMDRIEIPASAIAVKGVYLVQIITGNQTFVEKLVSN